MKRVCVYCGSSAGSDPIYLQSATDLGKALVRYDIGLVYGGASIGLMGAIAQSVIDHGGEAIGVIPKNLLKKEVAYDQLSELIVVESMHERKAEMTRLSDGFIALPGGLGTLEELFESWTWLQLGIHRKPCAMLDVGGYYAALIEFLDSAVIAGFIKDEHRAALVVDNDPVSLITRLNNYTPPKLPAWLKPDES